MAHRGQERALRLGRRFRVPPRLLELADVVVHRVQAGGLSATIAGAPNISTSTNVPSLAVRFVNE